MTIKTLKMVRFGPYIKETVVDFEQFTGKVFLVSGDTGAGKTTIFDAVCYALYGEPSGSLRKNDTLRNQDSVKGDKSYVELLFTGVDGRDYLVHRDTRALRAVGDKPAAMTKDSVNLTDLSDKTVTKGAREVNSRVEALTGFDRESFIRVSILPQGEFDKFLNQNSAERRETLRNIFGTELYESYADVVQSWLKTAGKQADRASDACSALMNRTFETVGEKYPLCDCDEYAARIDELESSCAERKNTAEEEFNSTNEKLRQNSAMRSAAESVNKALSAWEEAKAKMEQLDSRREEFDGKREQLKRYELAAEAAPALEARNKLSNSLTGIRSRLAAAVAEEKQAAEELAAAEARQEQANSLAPEREQLTADISRLDDLLKKSGEADEAEKKMRATEQEISSIQEEMTSNQARQEHCQKKQEELSGLLEDTKQEASRADAEEAELNAKSSLFERLRQLSEGIEELSKLQKAADTARTVLARKSEAADNAALEFSGLQAKYYAGEAARLAKKLEKGAKCPVCGSTEHPFPAAWTDEIPSQQQLDKAEADSAKAARAKSAAERDLAEREGSLTAHRANVSRDYLSLMGAEFPENRAAEAVSEKTEAVWKQLDEASIRLEGCRWAQLRIESLEKQLSAQKEIQDSLAERQEKLKNKASALQSRHAAEEATLNEKRAGLEGRDMDRLRRDKADKIARGSEIDSMMKSAAYKLAAASRNAASAASLRGKLEDDLERTQKEFSEAEETLCMQISRCGFADEQELAANYVRISTLQSLRAEISEHDKSVSAARARLDECEQRLPEDRTPRSTEEFDQAEKVLSAELEERKQRLMKLGTELDRYASAARELSDIISASGESLRTYAVLEKLERAICGKGAERIAFETFIQMRMFKGVLQRANDRLKVMSGGRYEFELRTQNVRGNASEGLDINMIDNNSSRTRRRDVSTLSGGERFMASFALAIGLSDYTLQRGGNKQSDMLFVDEGFSSLDSSTFEMALNVIQGISAGRRMIGLVTHIDGIKQYFRESQIYVHKGKAGEGSTIEVKCGVHKNM